MKGGSPRVALLAPNNQKDMVILQQLERQFPGLADARPALDNGRTVILRVTPSIQVVGEEAAPTGDRILAVRFLLMSTGENPELAAERICQAEDISNLCEQVATNPAFVTPAVFMISAALEIESARKMLEVALLGNPGCHIKLCTRGHAEKKRPSRTKKEGLTSIVVNPGQLSYADAVSRLQSSVDPLQQGVRVSKISQTSTGLIRVLVTNSQPRKLPRRSSTPSSRRHRWKPTPGLLVGKRPLSSGTSPKTCLQRLSAKLSPATPATPRTSSSRH